MMMMGKDIEDYGEFCLPADFLSDDLFVNESASDGSSLSSPVESVAGAESENEDDHIAGLTRQMSRSFSAFARENPKAAIMATSPQSTLCGFGSWSFSSNGASPEGPSLVPSPPSTPYPPQRDEALDLLYAAAGRVARLGLNDGSFNGRGLLQPPSAATLKMSARAFIQQQLQAARFYELRRQQLMKQYYARLRSGNTGYGDEMGRLAPARSALPPAVQKRSPHLQAQARHDSAVRTALIGGVRSVSKGTGVFLPQRAGTPTEPKKKPVLQPARVLPPPVAGAYLFDQEAVMARGNVMPVIGSAKPHDVRLPADWSY